MRFRVTMFFFKIGMLDVTKPAFQYIKKFNENQLSPKKVNQYRY